MTASTEVAYAARRSDDIRLIAGVSVAHGVSHFYMLALPPLLAVIHTEFDVSYTELGFAFTVFNAVSALLQTQAGFLIDRGNAKVILAAGLLIEAAAFAGAAMTHSYWVFVAMFAVMGIGNTVFHPADYALLSRHVAPRRISQAYSSHGFAGMLGSAIAPGSVLMMYGLFGWRGAFLGTAIIGAGAALIVLLLADGNEETAAKPREARPSGSDWALLLSAPIMLNFLFFMLLALASFGVQNFLIVGLHARHGTDAVVANAALSGYLLLSAFGILAGGWLASRFTHYRLMAAIGLSATAVATLLMAEFDMGPMLLIGMMSAAGLLYGAVMPSRDMIVREVTPPGAFGAVFGFVTNGFNIAGILAPLLFGALLDHGAPRLFFYTIAAFGLASVISVACVPRRPAAP
jgi:FSR family fosmidomycin resistance protein-like MFS transporter